MSSTRSGRPNSATAGPSTSCIDQDVVCTSARLVSSSPRTARRMGEPPDHRHEPAIPSASNRRRTATAARDVGDLTAPRHSGPRPPGPATLRTRRSRPVPRAKFAHLHDSRPFLRFDEPRGDVGLTDRRLQIVGERSLRGRAGWSPTGSPSNEAPNLNPAPQWVNIPGRAGCD